MADVAVIDSLEQGGVGRARDDDVTVQGDDDVTEQGDGFTDVNFSFLTGASASTCRGISAGACRGVSAGTCRSVSVGSCRGVSAGSCRGVSAGACRGVLTGTCRGVSAGVCRGVLTGTCRGVSAGAFCGILTGTCRSVSAGACRGVSTGVSRGVLRSACCGVLGFASRVTSLPADLCEIVDGLCGEAVTGLVSWSAGEDDVQVCCAGSNLGSDIHCGCLRGDGVLMCVRGCDTPTEGVLGGVGGCCWRRKLSGNRFLMRSSRLPRSRDVRVESSVSSVSAIASLLTSPVGPWVTPKKGCRPV